MASPPRVILPFRIGNGFDMHRLEPGLPLVIGGVRIAHTKGSVAHSDGDAATHAIIDSLLGAVGLGDIGTHFPPTDQSIKGISSLEMLVKVARLVNEQGYDIGNIDATIICEAPKLSPHYNDMRACIASTLTIEENRISFKAKTAERLGPIGNGEAIAAYAVSLLLARENFIKEKS